MTYLGRMIPCLGILFCLGCPSVTVTDLEPELFEAPDCTGTSPVFSTHIIDIFDTRGCTNTDCHGNGSSSGTLNLDTDDDEGGELVSGVHGEIVSTRIDTTNPALSLLLTKPWGIDHGDNEAIFPSSLDLDYLSIYCWIDEGAIDDQAP